MEANLIVSDVLREGNYEKWSLQVKSYLLGRDLWRVIEVNDVPEVKAWRQDNALAFHAILVSCGDDAFAVIRTTRSAKSAWAALENKYGKRKAVDESQGPLESQSQPKPIQGPIMPCNPSCKQYWSLFKAVSNGKWDEVEAILNQDSEAITAKMPFSGKNVLHVAVSEGHLHIVEKLMNRMEQKDLEIRRADGFTPLSAAIEIGSVAIARCLIEKHGNSVTIIDPNGLPLQHAIIIGKRQMVPYLYSVTPIDNLMSLDGALLLAQCFFCKHYDVALDLLNRFPNLIITSYSPGESPLMALAKFTEFTANESSLRFWQRWMYHCIHIPRSRLTSHIAVDIKNLEQSQSYKKDIFVHKISDSFFSTGWKKFSQLMRRVVSIPFRVFDVKYTYELKLAHVQTREMLTRVSKVIEASTDKNHLESAGLSAAMMHASRHGNVEFITRIAKANPQLVWGPVISRKVIEVAIQHRQPKIFSLVYGLRDNVALASFHDENQSNMLHKAAAVAPPRLLNRIPGAALQMQRELQWFKEVEKIASPAAQTAMISSHPYSTEKKKEFLTAREIFTESHKDLVIAGEKWMKDTSSSCTVVGALIITVTFSAAFTFPGGNDQNTGFPMFTTKSLFKVFTICNAIALSSSTTSVLMFLGILTSRYAEEDFLTSLPKKLIIGLSTLFLSMVAMLTAFCAGLSAMFHNELWIVIPSICLASIPVALFAWIQFPLLVDILISTYGPSIFEKNNKRWI